MRRLSPIVLGLFFCSGASALVYEVIWSKYLGLMFGSTIQAQTIVLAVFMGGLALGNRIFGRRADLLQRPLMVYGYVEVAVSLLAFFFGNLFNLGDRLFLSLGTNLLTHSFWLLTLKAGLSVALLLPPTILMGGTLPLLAAWLQRQSDDAGQRSARFYSTNSLGAVFGSFLGGFVLVRTVGLVSALQFTALCNVAVGLVAVGLGRKEISAARPAKENVTKSAGGLGWASLLVALSGAISMGLEVLASRCLGMIVGGSLQSFAIVLISFILGIGLGSAVIASPKISAGWRRRLPAILLLGAAVCIGFFVVSIGFWAFLYAKAHSGLAATPAGFFFHQIFVGLMALAVLGLPAALLGAILPLCIRVVAEEGDGLGGQVGRLLSWNTLGAVAGVLLTGFFLMPAIGLRGSFITLAVAASVAAVGLTLIFRQRKTMCFSVVVAAGILAVGAGDAENWRAILNFGIFRLHGKDITWQEIKNVRSVCLLPFYEDAADATVSVDRSLTDATHIGLRINGKADATSYGDLSTQYLLAHLPMLARPQSREVFLLGLGSGITGGAVLTHPVDRLTIAENCAPVVRAAKLFEPWNRGVLTNSRTTVIQEDARTVLKLGTKPFDVIICEPSNPWVAGVGNVFSREFYELASSRLKDDGIIAQWFHIYEMHDDIVFLVLRTFGSVFPNMEVWDSQSGDIILLGSRTPWKSTPEIFAKSYARPLARADLERIGLRTPESVLARQLASQRTAFAIAGSGVMQSDYFPVLEYAAPRAFFLGQRATLLFDFDERTGQGDLAPGEKKAALAGLSGKDLGAVFGEFASGNPEVTSYVAWLQANAKTNIYGPSPLLPVIFRPAESYPATADKSSGDSPLRRQVMEGWAMIYRQPERWQQGVKLVDAAVAALSRAGGTGTDWSPGRAAALSVRVRLEHGDFDGALKSLAAGLAVDPHNPQLLYLERILERAGTDLKK